MGFDTHDKGYRILGSRLGSRYLGKLPGCGGRGGGKQVSPVAATVGQNGFTSEQVSSKVNDAS